MTYRFRIFAFDDRAAVTRDRRDRSRSSRSRPRAGAAAVPRRRADHPRGAARALWGGDTHVDFDRGLALRRPAARGARRLRRQPSLYQTLPVAVFIHRSGREKTDVRRLTFGVRRSTEAENRNTSRTSNHERQRTNDRRGSFGFRALLLASAAVFLIVAGGGWWAVSRTRVPSVRSWPSPYSTTKPATRRASARPTIADVIVERLTALGPSRLGVNGSSKVLRNPRADRDPRTVARANPRRIPGRGHLRPRTAACRCSCTSSGWTMGPRWVQRISRSPDDALGRWTRMWRRRLKSGAPDRAQDGVQVS